MRDGTSTMIPYTRILYARWFMLFSCHKIHNISSDIEGMERIAYHEYLGNRRGFSFEIEGSFKIELEVEQYIF